MKKVISLMLVLLLAAMLFAGCGKTAGNADTPAQSGAIDALKTMGDVSALNCETYQSTYYEDSVVYAFELDGVYYRASAPVSKETSEALWALDTQNEADKQKELEILNTIGIEKLENLSDQILGRQALDALAGKTGQQLLDEGWTTNGSYMLDKMEIWMNYGPFTYSVFFDGHVDEANFETFDVDEDIKPLKVKSAEFLMLGEAT